MDNQIPSVSIGLPVYNGENYVAVAIQSILAQTYGNFELIISDNASTDRTQEICDAYAAKDSRIKYYRSGQNKGATWNFNYVFQLATGHYFKWAAHDDLLDPKFLEKCVNVLDQDSSTVLVYPMARIIGQHGESLENYDEFALDMSSLKPSIRFRELLNMHACYEIFGLTRASALRRTSLIRNGAHGDGLLLAQLSLIGRFYEIPEYLFFPRKHAEQSMNIYGCYDGKVDYHSYMDWFDPAKSGKLKFPYWQMLVTYLRIVWTADIKFYERIKCYMFFVLIWVRHRRYRLRQDLVIAFRQIMDSSRTLQPYNQERQRG